LANIPHFDLPFRYTGYPPKPAMVEQDSVDDVAVCVQAILLTEPGQRLGMPDFGVDDQSFRQGGASVDELKRAVMKYEPRVGLDFEKEWDFAVFAELVKVIIKGANVG
jgi:phage baseplate assembly protein W